MTSEIFYLIINLFQDNAVVLSFLSGVLGDEIWLLVLSGMSANHVFPLWVLFIFFYMGVVLFDLFYFWLGKRKFLKKLKKIKFVEKANRKVSEITKVYSVNKRKKILFISKFVYGTFVPTTIYFSRKGMKYKDYFFADILINFVWMLIIVPTGWFAGKGIKFFITLKANIWLLISFVLIIFLVVKVIEKFLVDKINRQKIK